MDLYVMVHILLLVFFFICHSYQFTSWDSLVLFFLLFSVSVVVFFLSLFPLWG